MIYERLDDLPPVSDYFRRFIEREMFWYVEDLVPIDTIATRDFILSFCDKLLRKRLSPEFLDRFVESSLRAFSVPLYSLTLHPERTEAADFVTGLLRQLSSLLVKSFSFPKFLRLIVVVFQELPFKLLRSLLLSTLSDYDYDLDQALSMAQLYHDDEVRAHCEYVQRIGKGYVYTSVVCCACGHRLFGVSSDIKIFPCGHIFHDTDSCAPRAVCPVCNKVERFDQATPPPARAITRSTRQLARFEQLLARKRNPADVVDEDLDRISIAPRRTFPT
jgi:hypothetical protein